MLSIAMYLLATVFEQTLKKSSINQLEVILTIKVCFEHFDLHSLCCNSTSQIIRSA